MKNRAWIWIIAGFIGLTLVAVLVLPKLRPYTFHGTLIQSQDVSPDFTLTTQDGQAASLSDFRGRSCCSILDYTFCPDVCPATLAEVNKALEQLGGMADDVQVIMVTVDPERDTAEKLSEYLKHFNPTFIGFTGSPQQIAETAALYGIYYGKQEGSDATDYLVDHTASLMVIDDGGHSQIDLPIRSTRTRNCG